MVEKNSRIVPEQYWREKELADFGTVMETKIDSNKLKYAMNKIKSNNRHFLFNRGVIGHPRQSNGANVACSQHVFIANMGGKIHCSIPLPAVKIGPTVFATFHIGSENIFQNTILINADSSWRIRKIRSEKNK